MKKKYNKKQILLYGLGLFFIFLLPIMLGLLVKTYKPEWVARRRLKEQVREFTFDKATAYAGSNEDTRHLSIGNTDITLKTSDITVNLTTRNKITFNFVSAETPAEDLTLEDFMQVLLSEKYNMRVVKVHIHEDDLITSEEEPKDKPIKLKSIENSKKEEFLMTINSNRGLKSLFIFLILMLILLLFLTFLYMREKKKVNDMPPIKKPKKYDLSEVKVEDYKIYDWLKGSTTLGIFRKLENSDMYWTNRLILQSFILTLVYEGRETTTLDIIDENEPFTKIKLTLTDGYTVIVTLDEPDEFDTRSGQAVGTMIIKDSSGKLSDPPMQPSGTSKRIEEGKFYVWVDNYINTLGLFDYIKVLQ